MFRAGDTVMYGTFGICRVESVEKRDFLGEEKEYYVLRHVASEKNTFYVPVDNEATVRTMHRVCSREEVDGLIEYMNSAEPIWSDNEMKRKEEFSRIIRDGDRKELISLIRALYIHRKEVARAGKKLHSSDLNYLSLAENMLFEEFAYALGIERSEVVSYIEDRIA